MLHQPVQRLPRVSGPVFPAESADSCTFRNLPGPLTTAPTAGGGMGGLLARV